MLLLLALLLVFAASFVFCAATSDVWYGDNNIAIVEIRNIVSIPAAVLTLLYLIFL
jgi:hypothetical protein